MGSERRLSDLEWLVILTAALAGAAVWLVMGRGREAWDRPEYMQVGLPALALLVFGLGWLRPNTAPFLGFAAIAPQPLLMFTLLGFGNLWPIGLFGFLLLALLMTLPAALGAALSRRRARGGE